MLKFLAVLPFLIMFTSSRQSKSPSRVIFFGDSITEMGVQEKGYLWLMNRLLNEKGLGGKYQLEGAGIGGNKVYDLFFRMEKDVLAKKPDVVVIWIGVNDVWHKTSFGTGTDSDKFEKMYDGMVSKLQSAGIRVFCCTPACIGEKTDFSNAQDGDLNEYSKIIRRVARQHNAGLIDFRKEFLDYNLKHNPTSLYSGILTYDGVHLNDAGNRLVADMMWAAVIGNK